MNVVAIRRQPASGISALRRMTRWTTQVGFLERRCDEGTPEACLPWVRHRRWANGTSQSNSRRHRERMKRNIYGVWKCQEFEWWGRLRPYGMLGEVRQSTDNEGQAGTAVDSAGEPEALDDDTDGCGAASDRRDVRQWRDDEAANLTKTA